MSRYLLVILSMSYDATDSWAWFGARTVYELDGVDGGEPERASQEMVRMLAPSPYAVVTVDDMEERKLAWRMGEWGGTSFWAARGGVRGSRLGGRWPFALRAEVLRIRELRGDESCRLDDVSWGWADSWAMVGSCSAHGGGGGRTEERRSEGGEGVLVAG